MATGQPVPLAALMWMGASGLVRDWLESLLKDRAELQRVFIKAARARAFKARIMAEIMADAAIYYRDYPFMLPLIEDAIASLSTARLLELFRECTGMLAPGGLLPRLTTKRDFVVDPVPELDAKAAEHLLARLVALAYAADRVSHGAQVDARSGPSELLVSRARKCVARGWDRK